MGFKDNINRNIVNKEPFWGSYKELNNVRIPEAEEIQRYQLQKMKEFFDLSLKQDKKTSSINELFTSGDINSLISQSTNDQEMSLNKAVTSIVNNISEFRDLTKWTLQKDNASRYEQAQEKLIQLSAILTELKEKVSINSPIYNNDLERLNHLIAVNSLKSFNQTEMSSWIKNLNNIQGELIEELGTAWLAKKIPQDLDIAPLSSGKLYYSGGKYGAAGSLIQDILILDVAKIDLRESIDITYKIDGKSYTTNLGNFLNKVSLYNDKKQISIDDNLYETLLNLSALNIQSKSGKNQLPWNAKSQNTHISIGDFAAADGLTISVLRTFELLHSLEQEDPEGKWIINKTSEDYNALANYGVATVLNKVLHLSENGNQYLLTPSGFITFEQRLAELFTSGESMVKIRGNVTIDDSTLSKMYSVGLHNP